jgi:hypothetical protein
MGCERGDALAYTSRRIQSSRTPLPIKIFGLRFRHTDKNEGRIKKESFRRGREAFFDYSVASIFGAEAAEVSGLLFAKNQEHGRLVWSHAPVRGGLPRRANLTRDYFFLVVFFLAFLAAFFFITASPPFI